MDGYDSSMQKTRPESETGPAYPIASVNNALLLLLLFREQPRVRLTDAAFGPVHSPASALPPHDTALPSVVSRTTCLIGAENLGLAPGPGIHSKAPWLPGLSAMQFARVNAQVAVGHLQRIAQLGERQRGDSG